MKSLEHLVKYKSLQSQIKEILSYRLIFSIARNSAFIARNRFSSQLKNNFYDRNNKQYKKVASCCIVLETAFRGF